MSYPGPGPSGPWPPQGPPPQGPYPYGPGGPGPQPPRRGNGALIAVLAAVGVLGILAVVAVIGVVIWASNRADDASNLTSATGATTATTTDDYSASTTPGDYDSTPTPGLPPPAATTTPSVDYYGAIAVSTQTGNVGYAVNALSRADAESKALSQCGVSSCQAATWWRNACGAIVHSQSDMSWGWAWATSEQAATDAATSRLTGGSPKVIFSRCTSNVG
ncbi:DUF4189 domain-containing protein [Gordonia aichiensis]|uniref:DUF4189 domain-containing protein n=1 Tax=Gordonia aichiensis NBRC 108223 TaxID=1220583 RepID=L7KNV6_9ACTN|nr:DUF4189 domain-containing protein [Gordonia aichiensis]GAC49632.1 hypothetical protein GOACH_16_00130 [Gordonia aichiensis NBRC 108223]